MTEKGNFPNVPKLEVILTVDRMANRCKGFPGSRYEECGMRTGGGVSVNTVGARNNVGVGLMELLYSTSINYNCYSLAAAHAFCTRLTLQIPLNYIKVIYRYEAH